MQQIQRFRFHTEIEITIYFASADIGSSSAFMYCCDKRGVGGRGTLLWELQLISWQILSVSFIDKLSAAINCPEQSPHYQERKEGC